MAIIRSSLFTHGDNTIITFNMGSISSKDDPLVHYIFAPCFIFTMLACSACYEMIMTVCKALKRACAAMMCIHAPVVPEPDAPVVP